MDHEIELVSDGDGLAVIGEETAVEKFLNSRGLLASSRQLESRRLTPLLTIAADVTKAASEIAAHSGRWIKMTEESAQLVKEHGLIETETPGVSYLMIGQRGNVRNWVQGEQPFGSSITNPGVLPGIAGIMAQMAARQAISEITDYLATIDEKLDEVRRGQKNEVLARLEGVALAIREAKHVRASVGRVSDVTWSKVDGSSGSISQTQARALRELRDLAEKLERTSKVRDLARAAKDAESEVELWLAVLARCFELQDSIADLELDRVWDTSPEELDQHRRGLKAAREDRRDTFSERTEELLDRMDVAVGRANAQRVWARERCQEVLEAGNEVARGVDDFHNLLGIQAAPRSWEATTLGSFAEKGSRAIQAAKDAAPVVGSVAALAALAASKKALDQGEG